MTTGVVIVFFLVYLGMILGGLPFLQLDRTGVALLGAIALIGMGAVSPEDAARSVHLPTVLLLFSFMVLSAQLRLGGFYPWFTVKLAERPFSPPALLAAVIVVVAALSAVFSNDIVCLSVAPVLAAACSRRGLDPVPYLLALACAANVGSAATLIGNPQNMLIGSALRLSFAGYIATAAVPVLLGLLATWAVIAVQAGGRWQARSETPAPSDRRDEGPVALNRWQSVKGLGVAAILLVVFLFSGFPREVAALTGAGVLLTSRRLHSNKMLGLVDWELLVLFTGLFVVIRGVETSGLSGDLLAAAAATGLHRPAVLTVVAAAVSNLVSNVPAVLLFRSMIPTFGEPARAWLVLAMATTLAGNLTVLGSVANLIVVEAARSARVEIGFLEYCRVGVPLTIATLLLGWAVLALVPV
jgi:Na+/H+ antiporter NhaD/arsenite permease-like protein